jgi:hypothetical protein
LKRSIIVNQAARVVVGEDVNVAVRIRLGGEQSPGRVREGVRRTRRRRGTRKIAIRIRNQRGALAEWRDDRDRSPRSAALDLRLVAVLVGDFHQLPGGTVPEGIKRLAGERVE